MTILVIGATGTVGSEVARQLAAVGAEFVCGLRNPSSIKADYPTVELDFARPETFEHAVQGVTRVFLVAPAFMDDAAEVIGPLIDKAVAAGATHVVYSSVMGAELNPQGSHRKLELAIEGSGAHFTHVRPNFFMQNFLTYEQDNLAKGIIYLPTGDGATSYIDVVDIAAVSVAALTGDGHMNKAYTLTGPEALTHGAIAGILSQALGRTITDVNPSPEEYAATLTSMGMPEAMVERSSALYMYIRSGLCAGVTGDVEEVLGRPPRSFETFAAGLVDG